MDNSNSPKTSAAQRRANEKYDAAHMTRYTVKYNNKLYTSVERAMADTGMNRNAWTVQAIKEKLTRDGYLTDDSTSHNQTNE